MILEGAFFRLPVSLANLPRATQEEVESKAADPNTGHILTQESTLVGLYSSAIIAELDSYSISFSARRVLPGVPYPHKEFNVRADLMVDLSDLPDIVPLMRFGVHERSWIEVKYAPWGLTFRDLLLADLFRLCEYPLGECGRYFLFVSRNPAEKALSAEMKHSGGHEWINNIFRGNSQLRRVHVDLSKETDGTRSSIRKQGFDKTELFITGQRFEFGPTEKSGPSVMQWHGYLLRIDDFG